jgi:hypothetical protein
MCFTRKSRIYFLASRHVVALPSAAQLAVEADAARLRAGGRAAFFSASVAASRRLHRTLQMQAGGAPLCRSHEGPGRAA